MEDEFDPRRIAAEQRLFEHGVIPFALAAGISIEQLEALADRVDALVAREPERTY